MRDPVPDTPTQNRPAGGSDPRVLRARAYMLSRQRPVLWIGNVAVMTVCGIVLWKEHPQALVTLWCACNYALALVRILDWRRFEATQPDDPADLRRWLLRLTGFAAIGGAIWGAGALLFIDPGRPVEMIFLLAVFMGIGTGALPALCPHYAAFAAFVAPMFVPVAIALARIGETTTDLLAGLIVFFLVILLFFGRNLSRAITSSITTDLENARLLEAVSAARDEAERANVDKSRFLAAVSHDLRQPLYALGLFLGSLDRGELGPRNNGAVDDMQQAYGALEDMFDALLEISRLDAGAVEPLRRHLRCDDLVGRVVPEFARAAEIKGLRFEYSGTDAVVYTDPVLLERVLRNLLSNAIKYTDNGAVTVAAALVGDAVRITVADTGHGIPVDEQERIYDEYHQLENPEHDRSKGLGLGLSVVQRTCRLLEHPLHLESRLGEGSVFSVTLPRGDAAAVIQDSPDEPAGGLEGLFVVVVDDEPTIRRGMETLLEDRGCRTLTARDADTALEKLDAHERPPDLLICDFRLADGHTGVQAIERLRAAIDPELPALLMTGDTHEQVQTEAERLGLYVLRKPVKIPHLVKVVAELV